MTQADTSATRRLARPIVLALGAAAVLALGLFVGARFGGTDDVAAPSASPAASSTAATEALQVSDAPPAPAASAVPGPAADPTGAVEGYLTAEATRDLEIAFTYLAAEEQAAFGTAAGYVAAHADLLGAVTGFTVEDVSAPTGDPATATVTAIVGFEPTLDPVVGLVPAKATVVFPVLEGPEGWTVSLADATFEPILPSDERAAEDARGYVAEAADCAVPAGAYGGSLVGRPALVEELCDADGDAVVADVGPLDDPLAVQPFLSAFGPDVGTWARVATATSPVPLRLVLAPYGDAWTVIGVLPPKT
ncbi:MAG: hypothetical protein KY457_10395 [Actinobacteria bacterium]|nr:hypothetical protein [Actinomycetota bacterium]